MNELFDSIALELAAAIGEDDDHARMLANIMTRAASKGRTPAAAIVTGMFRALSSIDEDTLIHLFYGRANCDGCKALNARRGARLDGLDAQPSPCDRCRSALLQAFLKYDD